MLKRAHKIICALIKTSYPSVTLLFQAFELGLLLASLESLSLSYFAEITCQPIQITEAIRTKMPSDPTPG